MNAEFFTLNKYDGSVLLVNDTTEPAAVRAYRTDNGPAKPYVRFSVCPNPWDNRFQQSRPGPIYMYGRTRNAVNSSDIYNRDDGFKLQVGTPGQTNGTIIASFDIGKGASDIPVSFMVPQPGLYPIRLVYYNGMGGANLEFFSYEDNGQILPINDRNDPSSIMAFYSVTTVAMPTITGASLTGGNNLTFNAQHLTFNAQHLTFNAQRSTFNAGRNAVHIESRQGSGQFGFPRRYHASLGSLTGFPPHRRPPLLGGRLLRDRGA